VRADARPSTSITTVAVLTRGAEGSSESFFGRGGRLGRVSQDSTTSCCPPVFGNDFAEPIEFSSRNLFVGGIGTTTVSFA